MTVNVQEQKITREFIDTYATQNPAKYALKKDMLERKLAEQGGETVSESPEEAPAEEAEVVETKKTNRKKK